MREVDREAQIRQGVQQIEGEQQIIGDAVAMRLEIHIDAGLAAKARPTVEQAHRLRNAARPDIGLQREVVAAEAGREFQRRLEIVDRLGEDLPLDLQAAFSQSGHERRDGGWIIEVRRHAIEA